MNMINHSNLRVENVKKVGEIHNQFLRHLIESFDKFTPPAKLASAVARFVPGIERSDAFRRRLARAIASGRLQTPLEKLGLNTGLEAQMRGYVHLVRHGPPGVAKGASSPKLSGDDAVLFAMFASVFNSSLSLWSDLLEDETVESQPLVIWTSSHSGVDLGVLATADAVGAVSALTGAGLLGLMGVTTVSGPLSPGGVAAYLGAMAAVASFLAYLSGAATVTMPRGPYVPAPGGPTEPKDEEDGDGPLS